MPVSGWDDSGEALAERSQELKGRHGVDKALALASLYYSARFAWPFVTYLYRVWSAKRCAREAFRLFEESGRIPTADQCDVMSAVLMAWPVRTPDSFLATVILLRGFSQRRDPQTQPHTEALLCLTAARVALRLSNAGSAEVCVKGAKALLPFIRKEDSEDRLPQEVRVLKGIALLKFELGESKEGKEYLRQAEALARRVSRDQLRKIWLIKFRLGLWF